MAEQVASKTKLEVGTITGTDIYSSDENWKVEQEVVGNANSGLRPTGNLAVYFNVNEVRCARVYAAGVWKFWTTLPE